MSEMVSFPGIVGDIDDKIVCPECGGTRLKKECGCFKIDGKPIWEVSAMEISALKEWLLSLPGKLDNRGNAIARDILKELDERVQFRLTWVLTTFRSTVPQRRCREGKASASGSLRKSGRSL